MMDREPMAVMQLNCQRAYAVMCDLGRVMCERGASVALLQELYVAHGRVAGLPSSWRVFGAECAPSRAAVVVCDDAIEAIGVSECTNEQGVCVWIKGDFGEMYVVSMYCRYGQSLEPYLMYMENVLRVIDGRRAIFGIDANAVSPLWFSKSGGRSRESELRGKLLEEWIVANGMVVLNEPSECYTFSCTTGQSDIDVTLVSGEIAGCHFEWDVKDDWGISDHNVIIIQMTYGERMVDGRDERKGWICKNVNWEEYVNDLAEVARSRGMNVLDEVNVDNMAASVTGWIQEMNEKHMKVIKRRGGRRVEWWTKELSTLKGKVRKRRRVYQKARKEGRMDVCERKEEYKRALNEYKYRLRRVKEENWKRFVGESGNLDPWGPVYRICRGRCVRQGLSSLCVNGECVSTWKECANVLLERFFPVSSLTSGADVNVHRVVPDTYAKDFEWEEVNVAVMKGKLRKAPGLDGLTAEMLRAVWVAIPGWLMSLYGVCLKYGCFPVEWKKARVVVLPKSLDKPRTDPSSYRPISLLSVLGKTLERMMVARMEERMRGRMHDAQHGFRGARSTESAWRRVKDYLAVSGCKYVLGVFVDFQGAFDNLEWVRVIEKLKSVGCEEIALWESYFQGRSACMIGVNDVVCRRVERGCPQGSICGPFVWNLMMDDLLWKLDECGCKCVAYADDLLLVVEGKCREEIERKGTEYMSVVCEWGENVGVKVSEGKTVVMLLKGVMAANRRPCVRMNGRSMRYVERTKYLGIWVGERMNFKPHLECLRVKITHVVGQMRRVLRCEWGMRKRALRVIYKGLFVSCVMYGASVWCEAMKFDYARTLVNRCQRVVLYACVNACRTVSTESLQVLMGAPPWDLECVRRGVVSMVKNGWSVHENVLVSEGELEGSSVDESVNLVNERMYERWQARWDECVKGRVTYEYIKNVRLVERSAFIDPGVYACFLLTGHGSMNAFLYKRGLSESECCACGHVREDWKHVLVECALYDDIRDLSACGVIVNVDAIVDVSGVLGSKEKYERFCKYAVSVFQRRIGAVRGVSVDVS